MLLVAFRSSLTTPGPAMLYLVALAALALAYVIHSVRTYNSLKQFGGHWSAGWSRLWLLRTQGSGEMHKRFAALNRTHGESSTRRGFSSLPPCWVQLPFAQFTQCCASYHTRALHTEHARVPCTHVAQSDKSIM